MSIIEKNNLPDLLFALRRKMHEDVKENQLRYALTIPQFEVLWFIGPSGGKSMESIANHLGVRPPSVTVLINKMVEGGLVRRESDVHDRRIIQIVLTEATKKKLHTLKNKKESVLNALLAKLSSTDKKELQRIISLMIEK